MEVDLIELQDNSRILIEQSKIVGTSKVSLSQSGSLLLWETSDL